MMTCAISARNRIIAVPILLATAFGCGASQEEYATALQVLQHEREELARLEANANRESDQILDAMLLELSQENESKPNADNRNASNKEKLTDELVRVESELTILERRHAQALEGVSEQLRVKKDVLDRGALRAEYQQEMDATEAELQARQAALQIASSSLDEARKRKLSILDELGKHERLELKGSLDAIERATKILADKTSPAYGELQKRIHAGEAFAASKARQARVDEADKRVKELQAALR